MIGPLFPIPFPLPLPLRTPLSGRKDSPQNPPSQQPPEPEKRPRTKKEYDDCLQQAAARRDAAIRDGRILQLVGGTLIEIGAGVAYVVVPVLNSEFLELLTHGHGIGVGYAYTGAFANVIVGLGPFGQGSIDIAKAWDKYSSDSISCAAAR